MMLLSCHIILKKSYCSYTLCQNESRHDGPNDLIKSLMFIRMRELTESVRKDSTEESLWFVENIYC